MMLNDARWFWVILANARLCYMMAVAGWCCLRLRYAGWHLIKVGWMTLQDAGRYIMMTWWHCHLTFLQLLLHLINSAIQLLFFSGIHSTDNENPTLLSRMLLPLVMWRPFSHQHLVYMYSSSCKPLAWESAIIISDLFLW